MNHNNKRCPECGGIMRYKLVQKAKLLPHRNLYRRRIGRYICTDLICKHQETEFNNDRERDIAEGLHDSEISILKPEQAEDPRQEATND